MTGAWQPARLVSETTLSGRHHRHWHIALLPGHAATGRSLFSLVCETTPHASGHRWYFFPIGFGGRMLAQVALLRVPAGSVRMVLEVHGAPPAQPPKLRLLTIPRFLAILLLVCLRPTVLLPDMVMRRRGERANLRRRLVLIALGLGQPGSYENWQHFYDDWEIVAPSHPSPGGLMALVFAVGDLDSKALRASLASLAAASQAMSSPIPVTVIDGSVAEPAATLRQALQAASPEYVAVLQAGEVVAPHAIAALARFAELKRLTIVYADEDRVDFMDHRSEPVFKPEPSRTMMLSGALATGIYLIRRDALAEISDEAAGHADAFRLEAWLKLDARFGASARLPFILTHRRPDTVAAPPALLAEIAQAHLGLDWVGEIDAAQLPLRIRPGIATPVPKVSLIVASTARLAHVRGCLVEILARTDYPDFEMIIVLSQTMQPSAEQRNVLAPIIADARVRVVLAPMEKFNYSRANNIGAAHSITPLICLLNDDVAPITPDWLRLMVGHLQDARIAAVGAKLYYPEQTVQHGGVIMGLGGSCGHAFRLLPRTEPGYAARARIDQEFSAVTGACLLVRKSAFDAVGGLDENFATAFSDVDLCLKLRAAGNGIVWSAQAELWHLETISFGRHYAGASENQQLTDSRVMHERWATECAADPFHNPNLSLELQHEWQLAFPPRLGGLPKTAGLIARG